MATLIREAFISMLSFINVGPKCVTSPSTHGHKGEPEKETEESFEAEKN